MGSGLCPRTFCSRFLNIAEGLPTNLFVNRFFVSTAKERANSLPSKEGVGVHDMCVRDFFTKHHGGSERAAHTHRSLRCDHG